MVQYGSGGPHHSLFQFDEGARHAAIAGPRAETRAVEFVQNLTDDTFGVLEPRQPSEDDRLEQLTGQGVNRDPQTREAHMLIGAKTRHYFFAEGVGCGLLASPGTITPMVCQPLSGVQIALNLISAPFSVVPSGGISIGGVGIGSLPPPQM